MRILSGIRPSGELHLGNYLGTIRQWIELQKTHQTFFMVADLHALTTDAEPGDLRARVRTAAAEYLAAGLNPQQATVFIQSQVPAHTELMWVLSTLTTIGELQRMTQFKEKARTAKGGASAGLFNYPVLMAADILLYRAERVPVGEDQVQHVELARTIAQKLNRRYRTELPEPQPLLSDGKRIMSLTDPTKKMSKTGDEGIALADEPAVIRRKLAKAVTATAGGGQNPGVANLFRLLEAFSSPAVFQRFAREERQGTIHYAELKAELAENIGRSLAGFRTRRQALLADQPRLDTILAEGSGRAAQVAEETLDLVFRKTGLR